MYCQKANPLLGCGLILNSLTFLLHDAGYITDPIKLLFYIIGIILMLVGVRKNYNKANKE